MERERARLVYAEEVTGPAGNPVTLMVRTKDCGYCYATTDLATIRYRIRDLKADRILYVVDSRQALHFRLIFEAARRAGWLTDGIDANDVPFTGTFPYVAAPHQGYEATPPETGVGDTIKTSGAALILGADLFFFFITRNKPVTDT